MIKFEHSIFASSLRAYRRTTRFSREWVRGGRYLADCDLDHCCDGWCAICRHGLQPPGGCRYRRQESSHQNEAHPGGAVVARLGWAFVAVSSLIFTFAAYELNPLCFHLAPLALLIVFVYSFTKRFTSLSHLVLGFALGIAPAAAWIAVARLAGPSHSVTDRRRDLLDRRLRHHLFVPGFRVLTPAPACSVSRPAWASDRR